MAVCGKELTTDHFRLHRYLCWSPRAPLPGPAPGGLRVGIDGQPLTPRPQARVDDLAGRYDLAPLAAACGAVERAESLYVLDLLDRHGLADPDRSGAGRALDVGSKNGAYLPGLATAWPHGWDAVELDAHRRYWTLRTRRAHGEAMAGAFPGCRFHAADVRSLDGSYARITWFLPFVHPDAHAAWGLAPATFAPAELLAHVLERLTPDGRMLVVNQGEAEAEAQGALFARSLAVASTGPDATFTSTALGRIDSDLSPFRKPRFGWIVTRADV